MDINDIQDNLDMNTLVDDAADISTGNIRNSGVMELRQTNVVKFDQKIESVAVDSRNIEKIYSICKDASSKRTPWTDVMLGIASLFAGAFISAIISGIPIENSFKSIIFYILSPMIAVGCGVAFFFNRKNEGSDVHDIAKHILEYLPYTNEAEDGGENRES